MKTYQWTELKGTGLEARLWCPRCGASNIVWARRDAKFWSDHGGIPTIRSCDACKFSIRIIRRESGVEVLGG